MPRPGLALVLLGLLAGCASAPDGTVVESLGSPPVVVERPEWKVGDQWTFRWWTGIDRGTFTTVVDEVDETGFTTRTGREFRYWTPDRALISVVKDGQTVEEFNPPLPTLAFPLRAHMRWQQGGDLVAAGGT